MVLLGFQSASRPSLAFNCCSVIVFSWILKNRNFLPSINLHWDHVSSHKNLGPIGSAVLTLIGYKQTSKQTDKQVCVYVDSMHVIGLDVYMKTM